MLSKPLVFLPLVGQLLGRPPASVLAAPITAVSAIDEWTVHGLHYNCAADESMCVYGFSIEEGSTDPNKHSFCHFVIQGFDNQTAVKSSFTNVPCEEVTYYRVAGGWGEDGYMILTIDNIEEERRAYFGYGDSEIAEGQISTSHRSPSHIVNSAGAAPDLTADSPLARRGECEKRKYARRQQSELEEDGIACADCGPECGHQYSDSPSGSDEYESATEIGSETSYMFAVEGIPLEEETIEEPDMEYVREGDGDEEYDTPKDNEMYIPEESLAAVIPADDEHEVPTTEVLVDTAGLEAVDGSEEQPNNYAGFLNETVTSLLLPAIEQGTEWSLRSVYRAPQFSPNSVRMSFLIDQHPYGPFGVVCNLQVDLDDKSHPMFASWYTQQCQDSGWYVSWGYDQLHDSAVATIIK